jgi:hypothetical protein
MHVAWHSCLLLGLASAVPGRGVSAPESSALKVVTIPTAFGFDVVVTELPPPKMPDVPDFGVRVASVREGKTLEAREWQLDPAGSLAGVLMLTEQAVSGRIGFVVLGNYDGRLLLIDRQGRFTDVAGGAYLVDHKRGVLLSIHTTDCPSGLSVIDLKFGKLLFAFDEFPDQIHLIDWHDEEQSWRVSAEACDASQKTFVVRIDKKDFSVRRVNGGLNPGLPQLLPGSLRPILVR